jgi:hypothetical protein
MKRQHARKLTEVMGIAGGLTILLGSPTETIHSAAPTIKVPGPYPYETPVQVPASPAPFPYPEASPLLSAGQNRDSRIADARQPLTPKAVREAAFKYNGVPDFFEFLAALPADVSVFDPKLGRTRPLVKGGRVVRKNVTWFRKRKQAAANEQTGT